MKMTKFTFHSKFIITTLDTFYKKNYPQKIFQIPLKRPFLYLTGAKIAKKVKIFFSVDIFRDVTPLAANRDFYDFKDVVAFGNNELWQPPAAKFGL